MPCSGRREFCQQFGQIGGRRRQRRDGARDRVPVLGQPGDQLLQLVDAGRELRAALASTVRQHRVEVGDHVTDELVAFAQRRRERAGVGQHVRQRPTLALQQLDDGAADRVDLVGVQALEHRPQSAQQRIEIQRRLGVLGVDRPARRQLAQLPGPGRDLQEPVADQVVVSDHRARRRVQRVARVDSEFHVNGVVRVELEARHRTDRYSGDADLLAGLEPRRVGKGCVVSVFGAEPEITEDHHQSRRPPAAWPPRRR